MIFIYYFNEVLVNMLPYIFYNAKAIIKGSHKYPKINGIVYFKETKDGIMLTAKIKGLPTTKDLCNGKFFGFHIHDGKSCSGTAQDEFSNAGSHYNPNHCPHPYHSGDLPPLLENNGYAYMNVLINKFSIKDIIGKTIIIHDSPDDFTTQPSGNSGNKIACGIIEK